MSTFFKGISNTSWIKRMEIPFMVSRRVLETRKTFHVPSVPYALDSGGFTELNKYGCWSLTAQEYATTVHRIVAGMGQPVFVAPQDWMCEPFVIEKSGLCIEEHITRTIDNYMELRSLIDDRIYLMPVIQGYTLQEYVWCVEQYELRGIRLRNYPLVGLGSICRRQKTKEGIAIIRHLSSLGLQLHGFGLKTTALKEINDVIVSSDSMAWSFAGRRIHNPKGNSKNLANDYDYMMVWYENLMKKLE